MATPLYISLVKNKIIAVCSYCGINRTIVDDHKIAKIKGGVTTIPACSSCNLSKGKKSITEWFRWLKVNDRYRWNRIIEYHSGRRSDISQRVHNVRDE